MQAVVTIDLGLCAREQGIGALGCQEAIFAPLGGSQISGRGIGREFICKGTEQRSHLVFLDWERGHDLKWRARGLYLIAVAEPGPAFFLGRLREQARMAVGRRLLWGVQCDVC